MPLHGTDVRIFSMAGIKFFVTSREILAKNQTIRTAPSFLFAAAFILHACMGVAILDARE